MEQATSERVSRWTLLGQVLERFCYQEGIMAAFLASGEGLHIASVSPGLALDQDELSGLVTRFRYMAQVMQKKMKWAPVDEISIRFGHQHRLVAQSARIGAQELVLIALVDPQSDYERIISQALLLLQQAWKRRKVSSRA